MKSKNIISILKSIFAQYIVVDETRDIESELIGISLTIVNDKIVVRLVNDDILYGDNKFYLTSYSNLFELSFEYDLLERLPYQSYLNLLIIGDKLSQQIKQDITNSLIIIDTNEAIYYYESLKIFDDYQINDDFIIADKEYKIYKQITRSRFGNRYRITNYCLDENNKLYQYLFIIKDLRN